jgi:hypothetical protein
MSLMAATAKRVAHDVSLEAGVPVEQTYGSLTVVVVLHEATAVTRNLDQRAMCFMTESFYEYFTIDKCPSFVHGCLALLGPCLTGNVIEYLNELTGRAKPKRSSGGDAPRTSGSKPAPSSSAAPGSSRVSASPASSSVPPPLPPDRKPSGQPPASSKALQQAQVDVMSAPESKIANIPPADTEPKTFLDKHGASISAAALVVIVIIIALILINF